MGLIASLAGHLHSATNIYGVRTRAHVCVCVCVFQKQPTLRQQLGVQ